VLRIRHHGGSVHVGAIDYGSTEGKTLHGADQDATANPGQESSK